MSKVLLIIGAPGSGKGTISGELEKKMSLKAISTGECLRREIKSGSEKGKHIKSLIGRGEFVSDEIVREVVFNFLNIEHETKYIMFDGYPRNVSQVDDLKEMLADTNHELSGIVNLNVNEGLISERLINRVVCTKCSKSFNTRFMPPKVENICDDCGSALYKREDDKVEHVSRRLSKYHVETKPVIDKLDPKLFINVDTTDVQHSINFIIDVVNSVSK